jgi:hypothetical protein
MKSKNKSSQIDGCKVVCGHDVVPMASVVVGSVDGGVWEKSNTHLNATSSKISWSKHWKTTPLCVKIGKSLGKIKKSLYALQSEKFRKEFLPSPRMQPIKYLISLGNGRASKKTSSQIWLMLTSGLNEGIFNSSHEIPFTMLTMRSERSVKSEQEEKWMI